MTTLSKIKQYTKKHNIKKWMIGVQTDSNWLQVRFWKTSPYCPFSAFVIDSRLYKGLTIEKAIDIIYKEYLLSGEWKKKRRNDKAPSIFKVKNPKTRKC